MKRSRQIVLESSIVAALIIGISLGGTVSTLSIPSAWSNQPNPLSITTEYNYTSLALFYNATLTQIADENFSGASIMLNQSEFLNYPSSLSSAVTAASSDLASVNTSAPLALFNFNLTNHLIATGELNNASDTLNLACSEAQNANSSFTNFAGSDSVTFANNGVPVSDYSIGESALSGFLSSLFDHCNSLQGSLGGLLGGNFTISSPETSIPTGGVVVINGKLLHNSGGLAGDNITFYVNGTKFASAITGSGGQVSINAKIPFVYSPVAAIWAVASPESSEGFNGAVSNTLYFGVLFNQTEIVVSDPPPILPTFNYTVQGNLNPKSGIPLPNAPVRITSFGENYTISTNSSGIFKTVLTVPANATDGIHYIYAAFAPEGTLGPSVNFTSIEVVHEPILITLSPISQVYSGLNSSLSGTLKANGSALSNASILVSTPWGNQLTKTDNTGRFATSFLVPLSAFGFSGTVQIRASPLQAYVSQGSSSTTFGILNPFWVVLPLVALGIVVYEVRNLNVFGRKGEDASAREKKEAVERTVNELMSAKTETLESSEMAKIYKRALLLAVEKFGVALAPSLTIREIQTLVANSGGTSNSFDTISFAFEDYLYSQAFDLRRVDSSAKELDLLEKEWSK